MKWDEDKSARDLSFANEKSIENDTFAFRNNNPQRDDKT